MTDTLVNKLYGRAAQGLPNQSDDERLMASAADAIEELREGVRELADDFDSQYEGMGGAEHAISKECGQRLRALLGED